MLQAIGRDDISIHPGASNPFCRKIEHAPDIHGESGLDGTDLLPRPEKEPLAHRNAINDMRDALMSCPPQTAWLVATGTLTNIALMFAVHPEVSESPFCPLSSSLPAAVAWERATSYIFLALADTQHQVASHIAGLSIMGGAIGNGYTDVYMGPEYTDATGEKHARIGNKTPFAEFNIWCDPEAAKSIFTNARLKAKTSLITLDLTHRVCATAEHRDTLLFSRASRDQDQDPPARPTRMRTMFHELLMFFAKTYDEVFGLSDGPPLHDPLAVAIPLASLPRSDETSGLEFHDADGERWEVEIVTEGEQVGRTKVRPVAADGEGGVFIPRTLDYQRFWDTLEECMARADRATNYSR